MAKALDADLIKEKNLLIHDPIRLYQIHGPDLVGESPPFMALAEWNEDVTFSGVTYNAYPIRIGRLISSRDGSVPTVNLDVENASRSFQEKVENYDGYRGTKVIIRTVDADLLGDTDAKVDDRFWIQACSITNQIITFHLATQFDIFNLSVPRRRFFRDQCPWIFRGANCQYDGAETMCDKTWDTCRNTMDNAIHFGGFPGMPTGSYIRF